MEKQMILNTQSSLTEQTLRDFITNLGHIPASPSICLDKISKLPQNEELQFFVNKHNLCWFADEQFLRNYNFGYKDGQYDATGFGLFSTNVRDIKLSELLIN